MRTIIYTLRWSIVSMVLLGLALATPGALVAQHKAPTLEQMLNADATLGTEYWIAIPPNEVNPFPVQALEVYVASQYDTQITVFDAATNQLYKRTLKPYEVRATFSGYVNSQDSTIVRLTRVKGTPVIGGPLKGTTSNPTGRAVVVIKNPEFEPYTGDILYVENVARTERTDGQAENIKFVVRF